VAVSLAAAWPAEVQAVVLENTYTCISDMVDKLMPFLNTLKGHLLTIKWDSDVKIQLLEQPILFISGDSDELVPTSHMVKLHELAKKSRLVDFFSVRGGTHNDTWERAGSSYYTVTHHVKAEHNLLLLLLLPLAKLCRVDILTCTT
jgi:fermentation-respiration switch protein FrsA (DUF1100 family)